MAKVEWCCPLFWFSVVEGDEESATEPFFTLILEDIEKEWLPSVLLRANKDFQLCCLQPEINVWLKAILRAADPNDLQPPPSHISCATRGPATHLTLWSIGQTSAICCGSTISVQVTTNKCTKTTYVAFGLGNGSRFGGFGLSEALST